MSGETKAIVKPPFRADQVGSLLRTAKIKEARIQLLQGVITQEALRTIEDEEIKRIVAKQKEVGLQSITDGEFRRAYWHYDFLENLDGVEGYQAGEGIQFQGVKTKPHSIRVVDKIDFTGHPMLEDYRFLHKVVGDSHTAKMTIPSPNMLYFRDEVNQNAYASEEEIFADLAIAYQKAIQAFYDAGCRYLQIDDTSWSLFFSEASKEVIRAKGMEPAKLSVLFQECLNKALSNRPDDLIVTMHICRGNFRSTWVGAGGYDDVSEILFDGLDLDGLFLEFDDERSGSFEPLRYVKRKDLQLVLGLITSKFGELENPDDIKRRLDQAAKYVPYEQLCLSPQCGFASTEEGNVLSEEQQWDKLRHVVEIANDVWK
nr:5-methyltetrahydropteroyltriglutamate--homocysteine S-methyltransferase [Bacillus sp. JCM 19034]